MFVIIAQLSYIFIGLQRAVGQLLPLLLCGDATAAVASHAHPTL